MTSDSQWQQRFSGLLVGHHSLTGDAIDAGARLIVFDDGSEAFRAALARHHRFEDDEQTVWIRPLIGGQDTADGYQFNLGIVRRRSLRWEAVRLVDDAVEIDLVHGQKARVEPADGPELAELARWDDFTNRLTPEEDAALARLDADSWHGRYA
ncbi:hypothetical protein ACFV3R_09855 [Streptomyces sp. NPDC059740]|uniref:hypothetical protein n=1 Tax=Streptomyces sp. NPDC059740 TaxID=3346926 RepID=UPI00364FC245